MSGDIYAGLLKVFEDIGNGGEDIEFEYNFEGEGLKKLKQTYGIEEIAGRGNDFDKALNLMNWLYSILIHQPDYHNKFDDNSFTLLERLFHDKPINCRAAATIFVECCLALGMRGRAVWLLPVNPYDIDCHVVPTIYCKNLNKWVMFDPTVNSIVTDSYGIPLSLIEIRNLIANQKEIEFSQGLRYLRANCSYMLQKRSYYKYLGKNLFYIKTYKINCFGYEGIMNQEYIYLKPPNFDLTRQCTIIDKYWGIQSERSKKVPCRFTTLSSFDI